MMEVAPISLLHLLVVLPWNVFFSADCAEICGDAGQSESIRECVSFLNGLCSALSIAIPPRLIVLLQLACLHSATCMASPKKMHFFLGPCSVIKLPTPSKFFACSVCE